MAIRTRRVATGAFVYPHVQTVAVLAVRLGEMLNLDSAALKDLRVGAILHDIGKIGVPTELLEQHGPLTPREFAIVRQHAILGAEMARSCDMSEGVIAIIRSHHERWDGTGYPDGLAGAQIPLLARIVAIADTYDAITTNRPYRGQQSPAQAIGEILRGSGTQFDPYLANSFVSQVIQVGGSRLAGAKIGLN